ETRAQILADYCDAEGLDLAESIAYADSSSDLPMLEAVGFPVAVNPETRLAALARKRAPAVAADRPDLAGAHDRRERAAMKALRYDRKPLKYVAAHLAGALSPG